MTKRDVRSFYTNPYFFERELKKKDLSLYSPLTLEQVMYFVEDESLEAKLKRTKIPNLKGRYYPEFPRFVIYSNNLISTFDKEITILHELVHVREDFIRDIYPQISEEDVDLTAYLTYKKNYEVLEFVKSIFPELN